VWIRTPAASHQFALGSPISLSRVPLRDSEAADVLLSLFAPRFESLVPSVDDYMVVDSDIYNPIPTDLGISSAADTSFLFMPGDNLSSFPQFVDTQGSDSDGLSPGNTTPDVLIPRLRKEQTPKVDKILKALEELRDSSSRISVMDMLISILRGEHPGFYSYRLAFLRDIERIRQLLDLIWLEKISRPAFESWINDEGIDHICKLVSNEMETAKPDLKMKLDDVSPEYTEKWDVAAIMDPVAKITPIWTKILYAASEPPRSESEDARNRPTV
jgi:hypothetical protein